MISEEQAERIWKALGALEAGLIALERSKTDRVESGALLSKYDNLERAKADRTDLVRLREALMKDLHDTVNDLSERISDRFNSSASQIMGLRDRIASLAERLDKMAMKEDSRGAEIARLGDVLADVARTIREKSEAELAEKANRWRRWLRRGHVAAQYSFQAFAGLAFVVILVREGFPGIPQALTYLRAFLGIGY